MIFSRIISDIIWYWHKKHPPLSKNPEWRKAHRAEKIAAGRGNTRAIGKARVAKSRALHDDMRGVV